MNKQSTVKITYSALCLALALVLPLLFGQIREIGNMLNPMHIPVLLCGFLCGWQYGLIVGFIAPLLRSLIFSMPVMFPNAVGMAFELAAYGLISGLMYKLLPKKNLYIYLSLIIAMLSGRIIWGFTRLIIAGLSGTSFPFSVFFATAVTNAIPGIILQLVIIPPIIMLLKRTNLMPYKENQNGLN